MVQIHTNRAVQGIRECERALELNRNLAMAHAQIGVAKLRLGQADDTEAHVLEALRLSPNDTIAHTWRMIAGGAKLYLGKDEEAVAWLRRSLDTNRNYPSSHFGLAAALAHLGRLPEARAEAQAGLAILPTFTISRYRASAPGDNRALVAGRERVIDGLRKAGVPEE
jgi:tetratricopeptide (TPR) repeat protein